MFLRLSFSFTPKYITVFSLCSKWLSKYFVFPFYPHVFLTAFKFPLLVSLSLSLDISFLGYFQSLTTWFSFIFLCPTQSIGIALCVSHLSFRMLVSHKIIMYTKYLISINTHNSSQPNTMKFMAQSLTYWAGEVNHFLNQLHSRSVKMCLKEHILNTKNHFFGTTPLIILNSKIINYFVRESKVWISEHIQMHSIKAKSTFFLYGCLFNNHLLTVSTL